MLGLTVTGLEQFGLMEDYWRAWFPHQALVLTGEAIVEDTRLRLEDDTSGPDGKAWDAWSPGYAATRGPGDKLLYSSGDLADSIEFQMRGATMSVGSDRDYALAQQFGSLDGTLPPRPYVGIGRELSAALNDIYASDFDGGWLAQV